MPRKPLKQRKAKPISLHPLEPEQALSGLMQVKPGQKDTPADRQREQETKPETGEPG
jgi:hypothetical protein